MAAVAADEVWAVGYYWDTSLQGAQTLSERWDGGRWKVVPSPNHQPTNEGGSSLGSVAVIPHGGGLWGAVGFYDEQAPRNALIERFGVPFCSDGIDNDHDGQADYPNDPGCGAADDGSEIGTAQCDDGVDNDGDGKVDHRVNGTGDPECLSPTGPAEVLPT